MIDNPVASRDGNDTVEIERRRWLMRITKIIIIEL